MSDYGAEMFSAPKRGVFKKELLTYKLKLIVTGADSYIVRGHGKSKKETSQKTWNGCALRLFLLVLPLSISGEKQDSE